MLDILIQNASIVDGMKTPAYRGDIAVSGEKIVEIGSLDGAAAQVVLNAEDCVVLPGFIDMHSHADLSLLVAPTADSLVHQGITTVVTGQCGVSPAPLAKEYLQDTLATLNMFLPPQVSVPWEKIATFNSYLTYLEALKPALNVVPLVGQGMIRAAAIGYRAGQPDQDQLKQMQRLVHETMECGAFGISTGLIYPPGSFSSTDELVEVVKPVGERGGLYFSHARGEAGTVFEAYQEAIEIGRKTGAAVQISHFKAAGRRNWHKAQAALELIDGALAEGLDVTSDMYPYRAGSTYLAALLPRWANEGGLPGLLARLDRADDRQKIIRAMISGQGGVVDQIEWDKVLICQSAQPAYAGHFISELAANEGVDPYIWTLDALRGTAGQMIMVIFLISEDNLRIQLQHPAMMFGTDGLGIPAEGPMASGMQHPRCFGTYPKIFGHYVRQEKVLSLEEASWKASGFPAQKLGLADRGAIRKGHIADLVILHPDTIKDRATYLEPLQYPSGIEYVLINGEIVIAQGENRCLRAGKVIRRKP